MKTSSPPKAVSVGYNLACVVTKTGMVECISDTSKEFKVVHGIEHVSQTTVSGAGVCSLVDSGDVYCWGELNADDNGKTVVTKVPTKIKISGATKLCRGDAQAAVLQNSELKCWTGTTLLNGWCGPNNNVKAFDRGSTSGCAALLDGSAKCWGDNKAGLVPTNKEDWLREPIKVEGISGAQKIFYGIGKACAEVQDKKIKCWGTGFTFLGNTGKDHLPPYEFKID
jgi:hypothetical protein